MAEKKILMNKKPQLEKRLEMADPCFIAALSDDLLHNILSRLPAKSFAFAACVSRFWNVLCFRILSVPKILSAFSIHSDHHRATKEVLDKILSEPIRPDFVVANTTMDDDASLAQTLGLIVDRVGPGVPVIVSHAPGILGKEACSDKFKEVKWSLKDEDNIDMGETETYVIYDGGVDSGILLTVGYMPRIKINVIPVIQENKVLLQEQVKSRRSKEELEATIGDKFVMDIKTYVSTVSDQDAPVGIILFGVDHCLMSPVIEKLDYAMPVETFIVGGSTGKFVFNSVDESRNDQMHTSSWRIGKNLGGLVFARDRRRTSCTGEIQFHKFISSGLSPVGPGYKAASVRDSDHHYATYLTARREGQLEILDGQQLLGVINNLVENYLETASPYIRVIKRRNISVGSEKPRSITTLVFHEVIGGDEHALLVGGTRIRTGDRFRFYCSDSKAGLASVSNVSSQLKDLKGKIKNARTTFFGGFIFSSYDRGESFFGCLNTDSSPFLENFPGLSFGGIFSGGRIVCNSSCLLMEEESGKGEIMARQCLHTSSTVYLLMSYSTPHPC